MTALAGMLLLLLGIAVGFLLGVLWYIGRTQG